MTTYSYSQLKQLWIQNGGNPAAADIAAAIALAESGGDSSASNTNTDGSTDRGLWQINSVHGNLSTFDTTGNVKAAISISGNGKDWSPWVTFVSGAYRKYLSPTTPAATGTLPAGTTSASGIGIPGVGGISVSGLVTSAVNALLGMLGLGSLKDLAERAGLIILGFALVILGIHLLASGSGGTKNQPITINEQKTGTTSGSRSKTSNAVSEGQTTTRKVASKSGATEAIEAAAVA